MKYKTFSSPPLVAFTLFSPSVILLIPFVFCCLINQAHITKNFLIISIIHLIMNLLIFLFFHRAFSIVSIDTEGIRNNYVHLKWTEVGCVNTNTIELLKYSLLPTIHINLVCISLKKESCSFWKTNKDCILISMNKKNLNMLAKYSNGSSKIINNYLSSIQSH